MLKRQRGSSPPSHATENIDDIFDPSPLRDSELIHTAKRRRTAHPVLDGTLRRDDTIDEESSFEYPDDEYSKEHDGLANFHGAPPEPQADSYKDTNQLLRQLHFEQQRRHTQVSYNMGLSTCHPSYPLYQNSTPESSETPAGSWPLSLAQVSSGLEKGQRQTPLSISEPAKIDSAGSCYENQNRLLGSAVLSRLQEQDQSASR